MDSHSLQSTVYCLICAEDDNLYNMFTPCNDYKETYAEVIRKCFNVELNTTSKLSYLCKKCRYILLEAANFKNHLIQNQTKTYGATDSTHSSVSEITDREEEYPVETLDDTTCIYCGETKTTPQILHQHIIVVHAINPRTGYPLPDCSICGVSIVRSYRDHYNRCHAGESLSQQGFSKIDKYQCTFCIKMYTNMKAYFTHLRMKHGLKITNDLTPKHAPRRRQQCHLCDQNFSQKQVLNKHLLKAHGFQAEKRKAYRCPLCSERVSYGAHFTQHLRDVHKIEENIETNQFINIDDFLLFKMAVQEETKARFRKTTASKPTIEGLRSHYMCSQSGVYVYQGKGKRSAPERQIYKTGFACPAHMVVTQTQGPVNLVFHKTHVGHGACPYYETPRAFGTKKRRTTATVTSANVDVDEQYEVKAEEIETEDNNPFMCAICGELFLDVGDFSVHTAAHNIIDTKERSITATITSASVNVDERDEQDEAKVEEAETEGNDQFMCAIYNEIFLDALDFNAHTAAHNSTDIKKCRIMATVTSAGVDVDERDEQDETKAEEVDTEDNNQFICGICDELFLDAGDFNAHTAVHNTIGTNKRKNTATVMSTSVDVDERDEQDEA